MLAKWTAQLTKTCALSLESRATQVFCTSLLMRALKVSISNTLAPETLTGSLNYQLELAYFRRPTQLSAANPTTWLSENAPEVLTYAVLVEACLFTKGPQDMVGQFQQRYNDAVAKLAAEQQGRGRRDEYRDGMLRVPLVSNPPPYARGV